MTLEEEIKHCEEKADADERVADMVNSESEFWEDLLESVKYYRQLAEWLKELKAYREAEEEINRQMKSGQWSDAVAYGMNKALVIMHKHIREVKADEDSD